MKRLLLLFIPLMFFFGCEDDSASSTNNFTHNYRYNCSNFDGSCIENPNGTYGSLEECEDVCGCNCGVVSFGLDNYIPEYVIDVNDFDLDGEVGDSLLVADYPLIVGHYLFADNQRVTVWMNCGLGGQTIQLCQDLEQGDIFCFDYVGDCYFAECEPSDSIPNFEYGVVNESMYLQSITIDGGYLVQDNGFYTDTIPYDCE